jgi:hypothetical protein
LCLSNGLGLTPVTWQEVNSWQQATANKDAWLARGVKLLSVDYVTEFNLSKDASRPSPIAQELDLDTQRKTVANQLKKFIKAKS